MDTTIKILVIDARKATRSLLSSVLTDAGYKVWVVSNLKQATRMAQQIPFEVVITELTYSMEALRHFSNIDANIRVIVTSPHTSINSVIETVRQGAYAHITKPFKPNQIKQVLGRAMEDLRCLRKAAARDIYKEPSITNALTDAYNYLYFHEVLMREMYRAEWYGRPLSLMRISINKFHKFVDINGRLAGDEILRNMARLLDSSTRKIDLLFRFGEAEFALLLLETDKQSAAIAGKRIHSLIKKADFPRGQLTVSVSLATYPDDARSKDQLIEKAQHG